MATVFEPREERTRVPEHTMLPDVSPTRERHSPEKPFMQVRGGKVVDAAGAATRNFSTLEIRPIAISGGRIVAEGLDAERQVTLATLEGASKSRGPGQQVSTRDPDWLAGINDTGYGLPAQKQIDRFGNVRPQVRTTGSGPLAFSSREIRAIGERGRDGQVRQVNADLELHHPRPGRPADGRPVANLEDKAPYFRPETAKGTHESRWSSSTVASTSGDSNSRSGESGRSTPRSSVSGGRAEALAALTANASTNSLAVSSPEAGHENWLSRMNRRVRAMVGGQVSPTPPAERSQVSPARPERYELGSQAANSTDQLSLAEVSEGHRALVALNGLEAKKRRMEVLKRPVVGLGR